MGANVAQGLRVDCKRNVPYNTHIKAHTHTHINNPSRWVPPCEQFVGSNYVCSHVCVRGVCKGVKNSDSKVFRKLLLQMSAAKGFKCKTSFKITHLGHRTYRLYSPYAHYTTHTVCWSGYCYHKLA